MPLRISIGACSCARPFKDEIHRFACELIESRMATWRVRLPADLEAIPREHFEREVVEGQKITLGTLRESCGGGRTLVVFQVLVHTLVRPTYFSFGAIGRMYVEGLVVDGTGSVDRAPDDLLWPYR